MKKNQEYEDSLQRSLSSHPLILYFQTMNKILTNEILYKKVSKKLWGNQLNLVWLSIVPLFDTNKNLVYLFLMHNIRFYSSFQNNFYHIIFLVDPQFLTNYPQNFASYKSFLEIKSFFCTINCKPSIQISGLLQTNDVTFHQCFQKTLLNVWSLKRMFRFLSHLLI